MLYLICPDKFRDSLTAAEVCLSLAKGILHTDPNAEIISSPMADGGEGSLDIVAKIIGLEIKKYRTMDPLGRQISVPVGIRGNVCYIETADVIGLHLLSVNERNPMTTSTAGLGQLLSTLITERFKEFHLFLGGSATNDAGTGMAAALGYLFLDAQGNIVEPIGANLNKIHSIYTGKGKLKGINFVAYSDVRNVMYGPDGAAHGFAGQKGALPEEIYILDTGLQNLASLFLRDLKKDIVAIPGSGAAGALAAGCMAFLNAKIRSGIEFFVHISELENKIRNSDIVITGEGKIDESSFKGKVTGKIHELCRKYNRKLIMVSGQNEMNLVKSVQESTPEIITILQYAGDIESSIRDASAHLVSIGRDIAGRYNSMQSRMGIDLKF